MIDLRHKQQSALLWCIFFIGRRILLAVAVVYLVEYPFFQITFFIVPPLAVMVMVGLAKPLQTPFENKQELYNNFSILILCYCLLMFTDFIDDAVMRYNIGYAMILLTVQNILVSLYFISLQPAR